MLQQIVMKLLTDMYAVQPAIQIVADKQDFTLRRQLGVNTIR